MTVPTIPVVPPVSSGSKSSLATSSSSNSTSSNASGPDEATLDGEGLLLNFRELPNGQGPDEPVRRMVEIVEESDGETAESLRLLRTRLKAVSLALAIGFAIFSVWFSFGSAFHLLTMPLAWIVAQYGVMVVLFGTSIWLRRTPDLTAACGRSIELLVFACPALFFTTLTARLFVDGASEYGRIPPVVLHGWMILIFAHSIFIPNPWRRAAIVSISIAMLPILTALTTAFFVHDIFENLRSNPSWFVDMILTLAATCAVAIIGVRTINSLRAEATEAKRLGRYRLREKIGSGGMGEVYLAEHQMLKRPCAIKIIRPERAGDPKTLARFEREVQATARLSHWNSVYIYDYGNTADGTLYYVMEYLPGLTLQELIGKMGPLHPGRAIYLLRQICSALQEAHGFGLIHRDVKPANLFVSERGGRFDVAKLLDFGLVKPLQVMTGGDSELTQQGGLTGSPLYMSPEQALGEETLDPRSDIYSLGAVAYCMLAGKPPFATGQGLRVLLQHLHDIPKLPTEAIAAEVAWKIPKDLETIVMRCLEKLPADRFASVEQLDEALARCESANEWDSKQAAEWWKTHCPRLRNAATPCARTPD